MSRADLPPPVEVVIVKPDRPRPDAMYDIADSVITLALRCWFIMLLLGEIHARVDSRVPALGYSSVTLVVVLVRLLVPTSSSNGWRSWVKHW